MNEVLDSEKSFTRNDNVPMCPMTSIVMEEMARRSSSPDIKLHGGLNMRALYSPVSFEDVTRNRTPLNFNDDQNSRQSSRETSPKKSLLSQEQSTNKNGIMNIQASPDKRSNNTINYTKVNNLNENNLNGNLRNGIISDKVASKTPLEGKRDSNLKIESNLKKSGNKDKTDQSSTCCIV